MYNQPQNQVLNKPTAAYILSLIGVFSVAFTTIVVGNATVGCISYHTPLEYTNFRSQWIRDLCKQQLNWKRTLVCGVFSSQRTFVEVEGLEDAAQQSWAISYA